MVQKKTKKTQKKSFFEVKAPLVSTKINLLAASPEELHGKTITLDLTRNLKGKNLEMKMKVFHREGKLEAEPVSLNILGTFIKRIMRKGTDYVEDSFKSECKDAKVIIKPFLITRNKVSRAIRRELRNEARKNIENYIKNRTIQEIFNEIMSNKIQKEVSLKLKKIYPLALCEIRRFEFIEHKK